MFDDNQLDFAKILNENKRIWSMNISKEKKFYEEAWSKFDKNSCISIDYVIDKVDINYSSFKSEDEIKEYLNGAVHYLNLTLILGLFKYDF